MRLPCPCEPAMRKSFYGTDYDSISRKPVNKYDLVLQRTN